MIQRITSLFSNQGFIKYGKNTSWLFAEKVLRMTVGLFVGVWVARYLGPDRFGLLSYAQSFVALFAAVAPLGIQGIILRELIKNPEKEKVLMGTAFVLRIAGSILAVFLLFIAIYFTSNDRNTNILIFIIASATIFQSFNVIDIYFQSKVMSKYVVFANFISFFLTSCLKIIFILLNAPLIAFAWVVVFDSFVLTLGFLYFYIKHSKYCIWSLILKKETAVSFLKDGWPLLLSGMVITVYMKIDQLMIKNMLGNKAIGNYAAAVKLSEVWYFIPIIISSSLFPAIVNAKKVSKELYHNRLQKLYDLMVLLGVLIAIPVTFLGGWIVNFLYHSKYNEAGIVLMIHIWSGIFVFLAYASGRWLLAENYQIYSFLRYLIGAILNIILNLYLINSMGIKGAAYATLFSYLFAGFLFDFLFPKLRSTGVMKLKALFSFLRFYKVFYGNR